MIACPLLAQASILNEWSPPHPPHLTSLTHLSWSWNPFTLSGGSEQAQGSGYGPLEFSHPSSSRDLGSTVQLKQPGRKGLVLLLKEPRESATLAARMSPNKGGCHSIQSKTFLRVEVWAVSPSTSGLVPYLPWGDGSSYFCPTPGRPGLQ